MLISIEGQGKPLWGGGILAAVWKSVLDRWKGKRQNISQTHYFRNRAEGSMAGAQTGKTRSY